ncbi:hypothetical protein BVRB_027680 [Beta vulgaris subsp. vulgaris]|uniref:Uncharacterized protein n=1 Tax=Beta vulgaris subsp. vulgaris TaxID=3555 RepID=A0A0J8DST3_BETVV|nr:hypothetical protein BVRB_027680 [Beta vulgaris subsp. vulgaris]
MSSSGNDQLAQAAAEDVVRRRYNAVMGIEQATEGWRGPIQSDCIRVPDPNQPEAHETKVEPRNLGIPLPPLKLIKQRRLPENPNPRNSSSAVPGKQSSIFPQWLWKRSDFQEIYRMPAEDFCIDMLMKPIEKRSHFEIMTVIKNTNIVCGLK